MLMKTQLPCCALCQISATDDTPIEALKEQIEELKEDAKQHWNYRDRTSGERAAFVIVSPGETILEHNLQQLKFKKIAMFPRRNGYPTTGDLKMYFLKW